MTISHVGLPVRELVTLRSCCIIVALFITSYILKYAIRAETFAVDLCVIIFKVSELTMTCVMSEHLILLMTTYTCIEFSFSVRVVM